MVCRYFGIAILLLGMMEPASGQDVSNPNPPTKTEQPNVQQAAPDQPGTVPTAEPGQTVPVTEPEKPSATIYKSACGETDQHNQADLCEQRRMAEAAVTTVFWTRLQFWISALGLGAILATLIYTARGTRAAIVAAEAAKLSAQASKSQAVGMESSLTIAKGASISAQESAIAARDSVNTLIRIERAHVWMEEIKITGLMDKPRKPRVHMKIRNYGNTIAFIHRVPLQTKWRPVSEQPTEPEPFNVSLDQKIFIPPRTSWEPPDPTTLDIEIPEIIAALVLARAAYALVAGEIEFTDTFDTKHVTGFAYAVFFSPTGESDCGVYGKPAFWKHEQRSGSQPA